MISKLLLAAFLASGSAADFQAAYPGASTIPSAAGGRLTSAHEFRAPDLGDSPEAAARAFLTRYGRAFGLTRRQELVTESAPAPGQPGPVRFSRRIDGRPVFDGDVVVGVDASNAVILVNAADVPPRATGRARLLRKTAIRAASKGLTPAKEAAPLAERGWRSNGKVIRPVWRVDLVTSQPAAHLRTYVDAETGAVLFRTDLRSTGGADGIQSRTPTLDTNAP